MHESKPSKGKARDHTHWQSGWWDLLPLVDGPQRPVAWSRSSVIYSAHPTQPTVVARHFPSSKQFVAPTPTSILENLASYDPPTVISVSPSEDWLFAFFPARGCDGIGCLWQRGSQLDHWEVREQFRYEQDGGVVTAEWTSSERPWTIGEQGAPFRLPSRGPVYQGNAVPCLLLITERHYVQACFLPPAIPKIRVLKASLLQQQYGTETLSNDVVDQRIGRRLCTHASIGLSYNEQFIVVATRSKLQPPSNLASTSLNLMDLSLQLDLSTGGDTSEWQQWGEEPSISLCMVMLYFATPDRSKESSKHLLRTLPIPPISKTRIQLTDLRLFAIPPGTTPPSPTITRDPRRPIKDSGTSEKGSLYLLVSGLDFEDYCSPPKSHLSLYSISHSSSPENSFVHRLEQSRTFDSDLGILLFAQPSLTERNILAGFLDSSGTLPSPNGKGKESRVGTINVLSLPDLKTDVRWENTQLVSVVDGTGRDIPVGATVSPNQVFVCTTSPSVIHGSRISIHSCPRKHPTNAPSLTPAMQRSELSRALVAAIYSRRSPSDIVHALTCVPTETAAAVLYEAIVILETYPYGILPVWMDEFLGIITELYIAKALKEENEIVKSTITEQWKTAQDIASIRALNSAFEDCREGPHYSLEAIWQLVGACRWIIGLLERLMKQCLYIADPNTQPSLSTISASGKASDELDLWQSSNNSVFLHILHPYALFGLQEAVGHIKHFRDELDALSPKQENSRIAKDVLLDVVDSSGVDINALFTVLDKIKATMKLSRDDLRKSLVMCLPAPSSRQFIREAAERILEAGVVNKPKLFIKPSELADGITRLSISDRERERDLDVVSKELVLLGRPGVIICVRCGGKSVESGDIGIVGHNSTLWHTWEKIWASHCVCGGAWMYAPLTL